MTLALRSPVNVVSSVPETFGIQTLHLDTIDQDGKSWEIRVGVVDLSPELAQQFLDRLGTVQRPIKVAHFASMIRDALRDRWLFTGIPVIFSASGYLVDGQHRCRLVVKTGKTIRVVVIFGIPDSSFLAIDRNAKRSNTDTLKIHGHKNCMVLAAAATWVFRWNSDALLENFSLTPMEVDEIVDGYPELIDSVVVAGRLKPLRIGGGFPAFCHFLFSQKDKTAADEFFTGLTDLVGLERGSPILALHQKLTGSSRKLSQRQIIISFFKAWNAYRLGKSLSRIDAGEKEAIPAVV